MNKNKDENTYTIYWSAHNIVSINFYEIELLYFEDDKK